MEKHGKTMFSGQPCFLCHNLVLQQLGSKTRFSTHILTFSRIWSMEVQGVGVWVCVYICVCVCIQLHTGSTPFISPKFDFCRSKCYNPSFTPQTVEKLDPPKPVHGPRQQPSATKTTEDPLQFGLSGLVLPHVAPGCGCGWVIPSICSANPEPEQLRQRHHDAWPAWHWPMANLEPTACRGMETPGLRCLRCHQMQDCWKILHELSPLFFLQFHVRHVSRSNTQERNCCPNWTTSTKWSIWIKKQQKKLVTTANFKLHTWPFADVLP